ncbi:hypothetical protein [Candidatus Uabimicrobium sp. HlEnr_7]|uniref:hypothetical protein n=1 Tax=Candidatus Uabimicrobium helgolandensis TaxID=3095367 RepID=UPI003555E1B1
MILGLKSKLSITVFIIFTSIAILYKEESPMQLLFEELVGMDRIASIVAQEKLNFLSTTEKKEFATILLQEAQKKDSLGRLVFLKLLQKYKLVEGKSKELVEPLLMCTSNDKFTTIVKQILYPIMIKTTQQSILSAYYKKIISFKLAVNLLQNNKDSMITLVRDRWNTTQQKVNISQLFLDKKQIYLEHLFLKYCATTLQKKQVCAIFLESLQKKDLGKNKAILEIFGHIINDDALPQLLTIVKRNLRNKTLLASTVQCCAILGNKAHNAAFLLRNLVNDKEIHNLQIIKNALLTLLQIEKHRSFAIKYLIEKIRENNIYMNLLLDQNTEDNRIEDACVNWLKIAKEKVPLRIIKFLSKKQNKRALLIFIEIADKLIFIENKYYPCKETLLALSKYKNENRRVIEKFMQYLNEIRVRPILKCHIISHIRNMGVIAQVSIPTLEKLHVESVDPRVLLQTKITLKKLKEY